MLQIVKLGGSLLTCPDLSARFARWLRDQPQARRVLIAGGGVWVQLLRKIQRMTQLTDEQAHWLAIDALALTARIGAERLAVFKPRLMELRELSDVSGAQVGELVLLDCAHFLRTREPQLPGERLGVGWDVTSDSIAARLATLLQADELVLLKSAEPSGADWQALAAAGYVDAGFARFVGQLPKIRCVNLRGA